MRTKQPKRFVPPKSEFRDALILNDMTENDYLMRMKKIVTSMFEWVNLPDTCNERYLEQCLYYDGQAALLYDNDYGFINTRACDSGYINIYGLPTLLNCWSYSYNTTRNLYVPNSGEGKDGECILVLNSQDRMPTAATIGLFAFRLANLQRAIDTNINVTRSSLLLTCDQRSEHSIRKLYEQFDGNTPVIYGDKNSLTPDAIRAIKTDAPFLVTELNDAKREVWNEFLTFIGVSNLSEKRERLITSEADSNNELVNLNLQSFLIPRQQACKEFNEKYGLTGTDKEISVRVRSDLYNMVKQFDSIAADYDTSIIEKAEVDNG